MREPVPEVAGLPCISRFYGLSIYMYYRDHLPPHIHVRYAGAAAQFELESFSLMGGELPARAVRLVQEWGARHRAELTTNWERVRRHVPPRPVAPLE